MSLSECDYCTAKISYKAQRFLLTHGTAEFVLCSEKCRRKMKAVCDNPKLLSRTLTPVQGRVGRVPVYGVIE